MKLQDTAGHGELLINGFRGSEGIEVEGIEDFAHALSAGRDGFEGSGRGRRAAGCKRQAETRIARGGTVSRCMKGFALSEQRV
jgi:hypothetical protein